MRIALLLFLALTAVSPPVTAAPLHNVILFVPDGLRAATVSPMTAPTMAAVRDRGVSFYASHALFPTFTTANASAFATGHLLGDTGDFSNSIYTGFPVKAAGGSVTPFLESDPVLKEMDQHFDGNYLDEESILAAARQNHIQTAAIGKLGPAAIQDLTSTGENSTLVVDDQTGQADGLPLAGWESAFHNAGVPVVAPPRGGNGNPGDYRTPGTSVANVEQQNYFRDVFTRVVLPRFKATGLPFFIIFWSRDPDGTQHNQGDSLGRLTPGINGPTSLAAIRNADDDLAAIRTALQEQGLLDSTDIIIAADHGFSTISKQSRTSPAARGRYSDVVRGQLPPGFLAIDLAEALSADDAGLKLFDAVDRNAPVDWRAHQHPKQGSGLLGHDPQAPEVVVAANGGSDLIYLPRTDAKTLAPKVVQALLAQDYTSGLFVNDALGAIPGTLPLSQIDLMGKARTPTPAIVISFRSFSTGCRTAVLCTAEVADTVLQQGQGMHGSFSRADTWNFMAASGPDFRQGYRDRLPASNADIGVTIAHLLNLDMPSSGPLRGRLLTEALVGGRPGQVGIHTVTSTPAANAVTTVLRQERVGDTRYNDVAGFPGRTVGLSPSRSH
jgi:Type I phosphodiesterase / nucleotide pyrophosphatase